jgi:uncharacterized cupin superfamily protein
VVGEAKVEQTRHGLVPQDAGWYVLNARDAQWGQHEALGRYCSFEGDHRFSEFGLNIHVLLPGEPNSMYHAENQQEDFLVLAGECLLIVEGEERHLRQWDFVHCPPWTGHVFVGAGDGPCAILMAGARTEDEALRYPASDVARAHGAGVERETDSPQEAYARWGHTAPATYRDGDLPG